MSKSYVITGTRFQRLYKADALTSSYAASADAATIASNLCDVRWTETNVKSALFPMHGGKKANDEANVDNRGLFDAAMFCAEHDVESGLHRAYAQAACYRFTFPDTGLVLQALSAAISCDPYTPDGARVALFTSDNPEPPMKCIVCRTGTDDGTASTTVASDSNSDGVDDTWTTTGRYADHVAPRRTVTPESGSATWYTGAGNVVFNPTGGLPLAKYLFVFVLLENYNTSRSGYLEGSAYIQPKVNVTLNQAIDAWDREIDSGKTSIDAGSVVQSGVDFPVASGGFLPLVDPTVCGNLVPKTRFAETPANDTCVLVPDMVRQYVPGTANHLVVSGAPLFDISYSTQWDMNVAFGESLAGLAVDTDFTPVSGPRQLVHPIGQDAAFTYSLYLFPMFNCFVRIHSPDTTPMSQIACIADGQTTIMDYWPSDYFVPRAVPRDEWASHFPTIQPYYFTQEEMDAYYALSYPFSGDTEPTVEMISPFSEYTHKGMVAVGANISSISCFLNHSDTLTPLASFAPGVRILFSSYAPSLDSNQISNFFDFVDSPTVFGLSAIQETTAYDMLNDGTATSVFIGDAFGLDSDISTGRPSLLSLIVPGLQANVGITKAVMLKDAAVVADTILDVGQTLGGSPMTYTGFLPTTMGTPDPMVIGDVKFTRGFGGDQQLVYVFTNQNLSNFPPVSQAYAQYASSLSSATTSVSYPVFVTDGEKTHVLAIMRLVSMQCPDIIAYPVSVDRLRYSPSLSTIGLSSFHQGYSSSDVQYFNVKPCFLTSFTGTFVQFWAPDSTLAETDFGACKGIRRDRMMMEKVPGSWVSFDSGAGTASLSASSSDILKPFTYANDDQDGTCSFTYNGHTISGVGEIFGVYAPPVKYGTYVYVYGSFSSFGNVPCHSVVRIRFVNDAPVVDGILVDTSLFPLVRPVTESESSDTDDVRFALFPAKSCSSDGTFSPDDVFLVAEEPFVVPSLGTVNSCKIASFGASAVPSASPSPISQIDTQTIRGLLAADPDSGIFGYLSGTGSGTVFETPVYPEDSDLFSIGGDETIGMRNCMARFYEGLSAVSPSIGKASVGPVFLVGKAKKLVKAWASTASGQQIVGKEVDVWRIIFASSCIPFSVPAGTGCENVDIDWSAIRMSEDPDSGDYDSESSFDSESSTAPGGPTRRIRSRYAKCTKGTLYNIWLNRSARVAAVPDEVAVDHAFYDATKTTIGDWELVATIDPYSDQRTTSVRIPAFSGETGTIAISAWYPFSLLDPRSHVTSMFGSGETTEYSTGYKIPSTGYGFIPDITFRR